MSGHVKVDRAEGVMRIALVRPEKKNALTGDMYLALAEAMDEAARDAVGALLIEGSRGVFSAGNDLSDLLALAEDFHASPVMRFLRTLARCAAPLVAAVDGEAVGIGFTLLLHCDLVYASTAARLRAPFVDLGLPPEAGATLLLPRRVGIARAAEILLLGEPLQAGEACRLGLVNAVVGSSELSDFALARARRLAAKPREALEQSRRLLRGDPEELLARVEEEARVFARLLKSAEAQAAVRAFMRKLRAPQDAQVERKPPA